jgi:hypothetical protein
MARPLSPSSRRLLASVAYIALIAVVAALAYLTFANVRAGREPSAFDARGPTQTIELGSFSTRIEKTSKAQRLVVSFKIRAAVEGALDAYVYVAARNDHSNPQVWGVWPEQLPGRAFTKGGHFRSHDPATGHAVTLADSWQRITAPISQEKGAPPFDTVIVYLVAADGEILIARPFAL